MPKQLLYEERELIRPGQEDWWYVVADDDTGRLSVVHEWSHPDAHPDPSAGEHSYSAEDFLNGDGPPQVKDALETFLAGGGRV